MSQYNCLLISYAFVFAIILIATGARKIFQVSPEISRKIIHIGVGNWIFVALYCFQDWYFALIPPVSFVFINYLSYRYSILKAMELDDKNPGTIYYALSLTILTILVFFQKPFFIFPFTGILVMTWGDGMAAVIGQRWPGKILRPGKSLGGSLAFTGFSWVAVVIYLILFSPLAPVLILSVSLLIALIGAGIEFLSPKNYDNLTVPITIGLIGLIFEFIF